MESKFKAYNHEDSAERIDDILTTSDAAFEERDSIPSRSDLTFNNGFYVYCSALFVDLRGSSEMPKRYQRPSLTRIYRSYISEMVAVMNGSPFCSEITIVGDSVWGVFDTPTKASIDQVFSTAAMLRTLVKILNCRYKKKKGYAPIAAGIGMDYGRALMIKAGYKGSAINDVVWMGEVVNSASKLCAKGSKDGVEPVVISPTVYNNLNDNNKSLLRKSYSGDFWHGDVVNIVMNDWWSSNCAS